VQPETRYAKSGDLDIAYQVVGEGPLDVVLVPGSTERGPRPWGTREWRLHAAE
jgi:hypothetical protein